MQHETRSSVEATPFDVSFDRRTGVLHVRVQAYWTDEQADHFIRALASGVAAARDATVTIAALIDARAMQVQSANSVTSSRTADLEIYRPGDRLAVVTSSALVRMQCRRVFKRSPAHYFDDIDEAEAWLGERRKAD
jgi:hypothetical protein